jgi:hypothetical protein
MSSVAEGPFSEDAVPNPSPTPYGCGISGILYSIHLAGSEETWIESAYANVSVYSAYVSMKGSYMCTLSGVYVWHIYADDW